MYVNFFIYLCTMKIKPTKTPTTMKREEIFEVVLCIETPEVDCDYCHYVGSEVVFRRLYTDKAKAIAKAQSIFAKTTLHKYKLSAHCVVRAQNTEGRWRRVYNKYKKLNFNIYGHLK